MADRKAHLGSGGLAPGGVDRLQLIEQAGFLGRNSVGEPAEGHAVLSTAGDRMAQIRPAISSRVKRCEIDDRFLTDLEHPEPGADKGRPAGRTGLIDDGLAIEPAALCQEALENQRLGLRTTDQIAQNDRRSAREAIDHDTVCIRRTEYELVLAELEGQQRTAAVLVGDRTCPRTGRRIGRRFGHATENAHRREHDRQARRKQEEAEEGVPARLLENAVSGGVAHAEGIADCRSDVAERSQWLRPTTSSGDDERRLETDDQAADHQQADRYAAPSDGRFDDVAAAVGHEHGQQTADHDHDERVRESPGLPQQRHRKSGDREPPGNRLASQQTDRQRSQADTGKDRHGGVRVGRIDRQEAVQPLGGRAKEGEQVGQ